MAGAVFTLHRGVGDGLIHLEAMMDLILLVIGCLMLGDATSAQVGWAVFCLALAVK